MPFSWQYRHSVSCAELAVHAAAAVTLPSLWCTTAWWDGPACDFGSIRLIHNSLMLCFDLLALLGGSQGIWDEALAATAILKLLLDPLWKAAFTGIGGSLGE